jgi:hypothetical protein
MPESQAERNDYTNGKYKLIQRTGMTRNEYLGFVLFRFFLPVEWFQILRGFPPEFGLAGDQIELPVAWDVRHSFRDAVKQRLLV